MAELSYITLYVHDNLLPLVRDWYLRHIGLSVEWQSDDFVLLAGERGARLGLHTGEPLSEPQKVQIHFQVPDIDIVYDRLKIAGLQFHDEPRKTPWGYRVASTNDPVGHTVELYTAL